jgi:hypothetical protein
VNKVVSNERKKLTATWFNTFATAIMTAGVLAPFAFLVLPKFYSLAESMSW